MLEQIIEAWPIVLTVFGCIIWFVRIEGKVSSNERDVAKLDRRLDEQAADFDNDLKIVSTKLDAMQLSLMNIMSSVANIQGRIEKGG